MFLIRVLHLNPSPLVIPSVVKFILILNIFMEKFHEKIQKSEIIFPIKDFAVKFFVLQHYLIENI